MRRPFYGTDIPGLTSTAVPQPPVPPVEGDLSNERLTRLLAAAAPGEWEWVPHRLRGGTAGLIAGRNEVLWPATCNDGDTGDAWFDTAEANEALIALAPALAREVLRLRAAVEAPAPNKETP